MYLKSHCGAAYQTNYNHNHNPILPIILGISHSHSTMVHHTAQHTHIHIHNNVFNASEDIFCFRLCTFFQLHLFAQRQLHIHTFELIGAYGMGFHCLHIYCWQYLLLGKLALSLSLACCTAVKYLDPSVQSGGGEKERCGGYFKMQLNSWRTHRHTFCSPQIPAISRIVQCERERIYAVTTSQAVFQVHHTLKPYTNLYVFEWVRWA